MNKTIYIFMLVTIAFCFTNCKNKNNNTAYSNPSTKSDETVINDTVIFKYVLGQNKSEADFRTDSLIENNIISKRETYYTTITLDGITQNVKVYGHKCKLFLHDKEIDAIMELVFYKDRLLRQEFYVYNNSIDSRNGLFAIYGKPEYDKYHKPGYPYEWYGDLEGFWMIGDKAVYLLGNSDVYIILEYMPLKLELVDDKLKARNEEEKEEKIKGEANKEKSKEMGW